MLALSRGPRNCSVEPARRMEKIGAGLSMLRLAPSKSGVEAPSAPTMTVQVPDSGGRTGNSKGGAGNVTKGSAVAADRGSIKAIKTMVAQEISVCLPLVARFFSM